MEKFILDYNLLKTLDKDILALYHEVANKRIDDLKRIEGLITDRAYQLFTIYYTVEIAVMGYVFSQLNNTCDMGLINASMAIVVFTGIAIYYTIKLMRPHEVMPAGRAPEKLKIGQNCLILKRERRRNKYAYIMTGELINLQNKINRQEEMNLARTKLNNLSINFMLLGLVLAVLVFVLTVAISR